MAGTQATPIRGAHALAVSMVRPNTLCQQWQHKHASPQRKPQNCGTAPALRTAPDTQHSHGFILARAHPAAAAAAAASRHTAAALADRHAWRACKAAAQHTLAHAPHLGQPHADTGCAPQRHPHSTPEVHTVARATASTLGHASHTLAPHTHRAHTCHARCPLARELYCQPD
jgi:hypothetical protein